MDCYSAESEFIESLDFLSPPVKRISSSRQAFGSAYTDANDVHLLRGFRNNFARLAAGSKKNSKTRAVKISESSTSLVLKKTSEGQILGEQYSFVSFPSLHQTEKNIPALPKSEKKPNTFEKPLIKVTVIPKTDQAQAAKLFRKRRYTPKRVLSTTSNQENSVQTKNVYLIVAGRRREKIYEIKTTGSAKLSTDHDSYTKNEDIPITELSNFKHLIQSLNMDKKKKKKEKKAPAPAAADTSDAQQKTVLDWKYFPKRNKCFCVNEQKDAPNKSRVRIFGQFGISEDDKYVLRYGATVDDKQVMSDVAQLTQDFSPVIAETSYGVTEEQSPVQQDSCQQADYNYDLDMEKLPVKEVVSKESQGTQVNFNIQVAAAKGKRAIFSDKKVQCSCCGTVNRSEHNTLKDCQSPMVIISVYPKPSPDDVMKSVLPSPLSPPLTVNVQSSSPAGMGTNTSNQVLKTEKASHKSDTRRNYKSPRMSPSPSPVRKVSRSKVPDDSLKPSVSEKRSPDRQKALRAIKEKIREKDKLKQDASSRKLPLKLNITSATQVSKNLKNVTGTNATQISKRNHGLYTASHATQMSNKNLQVNNMSYGTQVSAKRLKNYTATNGTQHSNDAESFTASNATQCEDPLDSLQDIAPIKHSINDDSSQKYPQHKPPPTKHIRTQVSPATQVAKIQQLYSNHATQVTKRDPLTISCATQVSKKYPNVITPRMAKNQETVISKPAQDFKSDQTSRFNSKTKAESGTNTDHARAKKALVDTYTKKLTAQMNQKHIPARFDNSKVTVNIDADREYYDVLFNRDKMTTDLTIRKTLKDMGSQKCIDEPLLGSLLRLPDCALEREGFESGIKSPTRSPSIEVYNPSEDELTLAQHVSRLTIRDSLEICHRREDNKSNIGNINIKNTQTCFRAQLADIGPDESAFLAPIKHFTGDDCSIIDPIERDKQIRELLGVDKVKPNYSKTSQDRFCENDVGIPYQCIYRQRCKESQVTEINYEFHKLCPCFKPVPSEDKANVSIQCRAKNGKSRLPKKTPEEVEDICFVNYSAVENKEEQKSAIYQQLILNRNIQVFLQVEQFSKQKPIILSRQQYDKVKKTIQKTINMKSSHSKRKPFLTKGESSEISIGEVRTKKVTDDTVESRQQRVEDTQSSEQTEPEPIKKIGKDPCPCAPSTETSQESKFETAAQTDPVPCNRTNCKHYSKIEQRIKARKAKAIEAIGDQSSGQSPDRGETRKPKAIVDASDDYSDQSPDRGEAKPKKTKESRDRGEDKPKKSKQSTYRGEAKSKKTKESPDRGETKSKKSKQSPDLGEAKSKKSKQSSDRGDAKPKKDKKKQDTELKTRTTKRPSQSDICLERDVGVGDREVERKEREGIPIKDCSSCCVCEETAERNETEVKTYVLYNAENTRQLPDNLKHAEETEYVDHTRKTVSSVEIRYASVAFMKQVAYSSTDVGALSDSSIGHLNSFHTLFRGHRKCATPNLGTSAYSLYSEDVHNSENRCAKLEPEDSKPKKPFLRRLMSCLVMRSTRNSQIKIPIGPPPDLPSVNSSIDSYHISTSLGAVEVSSSIYDTSASFYSNHTILPINSKIKRGFFSSVRGFLTNRKS